MAAKNFPLFPRATAETNVELPVKQQRAVSVENTISTNPGQGKQNWMDRIAEIAKILRLSNNDSDSDDDEEPKEGRNELEPISGAKTIVLRPWKMSDYRELLLLIKDPGLAVNDIAGIMQRRPHVVSRHLNHVCMDLLTLLGYFENVSVVDTEIVHDILREFRVPAFEIETYKRHKARREQREKEMAELLGALGVEAERFVPNYKEKFEKLRVTNNVNAVEQETINRVVDRIGKGTSTLIIGTLFSELVRLAFTGTDIAVICDSINRTESAVRHKLALLAAKFLEPTDYSGPEMPVPVAMSASFINDLIIETPDNFSAKYGFSETGLKVMLASMFRQYITPAELVAARKFNEVNDKSTVKSPKDQQVELAKPQSSTEVTPTAKPSETNKVLPITELTPKMSSGPSFDTPILLCPEVNPVVTGGNPPKPGEDQREVLREVKSLLQQLAVILANKK